MSSFGTNVVQVNDTNAAENSSVEVTSTKYDWASNNVTDHFSKYRWLESLEYFMASVAIVVPSTE